MKIIAYIKRHIHLINCAYKLKTNHLAYTEGKSYLLFGICIWFSADKISCTCGKTYYEK